MSTQTFWIFIAVIKLGLLRNTSADIPEIKIGHLRILDPSGFRIRWFPIDTKNDADPIIGIKIKVWRTPCEIKTVFHHEGDQITKIVKSEHMKFNHTAIPQELPENVYIVKPDEQSLTVPHVDPEVWYHVRALAFTQTAEGPLSSFTQFKINTKDENDKKKSCERIISRTVVKEEKLPEV